MIKRSSIHDSLEYGEKGPKISVLMETEFTKEIRILFKKGQEMKEHKTAYPIVIEIVEGEINFGVQGNLEYLEKGSLISLQGGIPHNLLAQKDSIVRLTLSTQDEFKRVQELGEK